jgi:Zn-dependent peptidase ImmA (M78 family)
MKANFPVNLDHVSTDTIERYSSNVLRKIQKNLNSLEEFIDKSRLNHNEIFSFKAEGYLEMLLQEGEIADYDFVPQSKLGNDILGKFIIEDNHPSIYISDELYKSPYIERFTIAHEIGHLEMHYTPHKSKFEEYVCYRDNRKNLAIVEKNIKEKNLFIAEFQANLFALCLSMPRRFLFELTLQVYEEQESYIEFYSNEPKIVEMLQNEDLIGYVSYFCDVHPEHAKNQLEFLGLLYWRRHSEDFKQRCKTNYRKYLFF